MSYTKPPIAKNAKGDPRKIGLELEFAGLELEEAAGIIQSLFGGQLKEVHRYHFEIQGTELGDFRVELDARILQKMATSDIFEKLGVEKVKAIPKSIEDVVDKLAKTVVPMEIVMPPVSLDEIDQLEKLRDHLQKNRAEGTHSSFVHAFGMNMNVESPDLEISTLLRYLRSFILLYPWLLKALQIDISRRISPFVDPYPKKYVQKILDPAYDPGQEQFIKDYVEFNPTRNRPIDMMPVFGMLDNALIESVMKGEKNAPRPTFHYRLPNSRINDADWRFEHEWNHWLAVEKLASNDEMVDKLSRLYLLRQKETMISFQKEWAKTVAILLDLDE